MRLIDADALKKAITDATCNFEQIPIRVDKVQEIIDNAPTVPLPDFKEGYKQAIIDGKTNFSRPKGEWIVVSNDTINHHVDCICSKCGHAGEFQYKFCRECGADMRKEAENDHP